MTRTIARHKIGRVLAILSLGVVLTSVSAMFVGVPAEAADTGSAVTVKWAGGNDPSIQQFQPDHAAMVNNADGSGKWSDFKDLEVSVSQTKNLRDQSLTLSISGMMATTTYASSFIGRRANNFVQVMQCWGPDPSASNFRETCQFGASSAEAGFGGAQQQLDRLGAGPATTGRSLLEQPVDGEIRPAGVPFRTAFGQVSKPRSVPLPGGAFAFSTGIGDFFSPETSNELPFVQLGRGTTSVRFEAQNDASGPYLGCGNPSAAGERCWLVIVPRGAHSGTVKGATAKCFPDLPVLETGVSDSFGTVTPYQASSPLDTNCSYWNDRVVVPLDFESTTASCPPGLDSRQIDGSELSAALLSSWQERLCTQQGGSVFNLTTNPGSTLRSQLLSGQSEFALVGGAVTESEREDAQLSDSQPVDVRYAPVANSALVVGVSLVTSNGTAYSDVKFSPRLVAKLLTTSYGIDVPRVNDGQYVAPPHLGSNPFRLATDPEFLALNPGIPAPSTDPSLIVAGPHGDDAIRQLWRWIQADDEARRWLQGESDENGMVVNPYFLPAGAAGAPRGAGLPFDLATDDIETVPRADQTLAPDKTTALEKYKGQQVDTLMMSPYASNLAAVARRVATGTSGVTNTWDGEVANSAGEKGAFATGGRGVGEQLLFGITDAATADRFGLAAAALQIPNSDTFVTPTTESLTAGVAAGVTDPATGVAKMDFAALGTTGYPLTQTLYGMADLANAALGNDGRASYAQFLEFAAGPGQQPGTLRGQLPPGYAPLSDAQRAAASELAALLRVPLPDPPADEETPPDTADNAAGGASGGAANAPAAGAGGPGATSTTVSATTASPPGATAGAVASPVQGALGAALVAGLAGLVGAPFLLRRRAL